MLHLLLPDKCPNLSSLLYLHFVHQNKNKIFDKYKLHAKVHVGWYLITPPNQNLNDCNYILVAVNSGLYLFALVNLTSA